MAPKRRQRATTAGNARKSKRKLLKTQTEETDVEGAKKEEPIPSIDVTSYLEIFIPDPTAPEPPIEAEELTTLAKKKEKTVTRRIDRTLRLLQRQTHMLCLLVAAEFHSRLCTNDLLQSIALSLVPPHLQRQFSPEALVDGRTLINAVSMLANWWKNWFGLKMRSASHGLHLETDSFSFRSPTDRYRSLIALRSAYEDDYVRIFMLISRSLGIKARFVSSLKLLPPIPTPKDTADSFQYTPSAWIEIFHPREKRWFPVDCIRAIVNCRQSLEIVSTGKAAKFPSLTHSFVIAVDELGYIVDVTKRYSSQYYGTSWHLRHLDEKYFFECLRLLNKRVPNPEVLYDEDAELEGFTQSEGIPEKLAGFHLHGRFVLENKLKKYEVFWPADKIVGQFKGENIHLRSCLQKVRSKDAWYTQFARRLKEGEEPVKVIQLPKRRKKGMLLPDEDPYEPGPMQPLYGEWQTEPYVPPVAIDGKVPKNAHGNVDLFRLEMLPIGCAYIPYNAAWKSARDLGADYANACVRFAFHGQMAVPNIQGIVVCKEDEGRVLNHYFKQVELDLQADNEEAERQKTIKKRREALAIKISNRLQRDYLDSSETKAEGEDEPPIHSAFNQTRTKSDDEDFYF